MANLLQDYVSKEQQLKKLQEELERMQSDERLQAELEFKSKLEDLMREYGKDAKEVLSILDPAPAQKSEPAPTGRRKRKLKVYKNPHSGEVVETRGGNQKTLKGWKDEFGDETVESWVIRVEE